MNSIISTFRDNETGVWECFDLASQGPCDEGEWFVFDKAAEGVEQAALAVCKARRCEEDFVWFKDQCLDLDHSEGQCPKGMELLVNPFGEGKTKEKKKSISN